MLSWIPFILWLIIFEVIADIGAKEFEITNSRYRYGGALLCYVIGNAFRLFAMKHGVGLWRGTILFAVISTIITLLIAYGRYKEPITVINMIGIALCMVWLVFLEW